MDKRVSKVQCYFIKYITIGLFMRAFYNLDSVEPRPVDERIWINL